MAATYSYTDTGGVFHQGLTLAEYLALLGANTIKPSGVFTPGTTAGLIGTTALNLMLAKFPESITAGTAVAVLGDWDVGDTVISFGIYGRVESGGNAVTVDVSLRKITFAAGTTTDSLLGAMTQLSKTADFLMAGGASTGLKTLDTPEVIAENAVYYFLVTVTTGATCEVHFHVKATGTDL